VKLRGHFQLHGGCDATYRHIISVVVVSPEAIQLLDLVPPRWFQRCSDPAIRDALCDCSVRYMRFAAACLAGCIRCECRALQPIFSIAR
jgi:hypothetical protein